MEAGCRDPPSGACLVSPCLGIAEGQGEGPEMFSTARVPLGRDGGGVPLVARVWLWEEGSCVSPLLGNLP